MLHCLQPLIWELALGAFRVLDLAEHAKCVALSATTDLGAGAWSLAEGIQGLVHCSPCSKKRVKGFGFRV